MARAPAATASPRSATPLPSSPSARDGAALCDLGASGVLSVAGPDAVTFLQGQVTNDVEALSPGAWQFAAWCSAKGRVLVVFALHRTRLDAFELMLPATMLPAIHKRLAMFVLRAKVVIEDASAAAVRFGIGGPAAADRLVSAIGTLPAPHEVARIGNACVRALPGGRFMISAPTATAIELWSQLSAGARPAGEPAWRWLRVRGGVPRIVAATSDQFVPQALNLDALDGVSFRKGCYAGQEIVARTQYLGRLKERLVLARLSANVAPPGSGRTAVQPGVRSASLWNRDRGGQRPAERRRRRQRSSCRAPDCGARARRRAPGRAGRPVYRAARAPVRHSRGGATARPHRLKRDGRGRIDRRLAG